MKNSLTKTVSILLTVIMTIHVSVFAIYTDIEGYKYKSAIDALSELGLVQGYEGNFNPNDFMTRAEFVRLSLNIVGLQEKGIEKAQTKFVDVAYDHWASGAIKSATDMGIINGIDENHFDPDANIKYEQALKIILCSLEYDNIIDKELEYPNSYLDLANTLNLTKSLNLNIGDSITRGEVCELLYRALNIQLIESADTEPIASPLPTASPAIPTSTPDTTQPPKSTEETNNADISDNTNISKITVNDQLVLVGYSQVMDGNGDRRYKIYFWFEGVEYSAMCRDNVIVTGFDLKENKGIVVPISALKKGDIICISQNIQSEVTDIARYAPPNDISALENDGNVYLLGKRDSNEKVFGTLLSDIKNNRISIGSGEEGATTYDYRITDKAYIYHYGGYGNKLEPIDKGDIYVDYDKSTYVYVYAKDSIPLLVVLYHY